jgi:hypothetical protein
MSSWDQANREEKLSLVWRNRKKISQIINAYLYLPFFLLIILCHSPSRLYGSIISLHGSKLSLMAPVSAAAPCFSI